MAYRRPCPRNCRTRPWRVFACTNIGINDAIKADVDATNGVAHLIDGVLIPPSGGGKNIVQQAESDVDLSILAQLFAATARSRTQARANQRGFQQQPSRRPRGTVVQMNVRSKSVNDAQALKADANATNSVAHVYGA